MSAAEINAAQLSGTLGAASLSGALSTGAVVFNDYAIAIAPIDGGHRLTITRGSEVQTMDLLDGVGIAGIEKTATIDNVDEYTITMTDGSSYTFTVTNGTQGETGVPGVDGGYYTPSVTEAGDLSWTASKSDMPAVEPVNIKGQQGDTGATGPAGYTPVKGVDYYTDADKDELVQAVMSALPAAEGVSY